MNKKIPLRRRSSGWLKAIADLSRYNPKSYKDLWNDKRSGGIEKISPIDPRYFARLFQ